MLHTVLLSLVPVVPAAQELGTLDATPILERPVVPTSVDADPKHIRLSSTYGTIQFPRSFYCVNPNCGKPDTQSPYPMANLAGILRDYIALHHPTDRERIHACETCRVEFLPYDWGLNDQAAPPALGR